MLSAPAASVLRALAFAAALLPATASASEVYKAKCALCHDAGATGAPRLGRAADWTQRSAKGYAGLLDSAMKGVPGTAMLPKAGFPELTQQDVAGAVRYMLAAVDLPPDLAAKPQARTKPRAPLGPVDDITLALSVADALVGAKIGGVQVEAHEGHITLKGMVDSAAVVKRALQAAQGVAGVRGIENRLISADLFEHD